MGLLVLIGLILLAGCARQAALPTWEPPPTLPISEEAAQRLSERVAEVLAAHGTFTLTITNEELTSYLALHLEDTPVQALTVWFTPDEAHAWARFEVRGAHQAQILLQVGEQQGALKLELQRATLDRWLLPRPGLFLLEETLNAALADAYSPLKVEQITLNEGSATFSGRIIE